MVAAVVGAAVGVVGGCFDDPVLLVTTPEDVKSRDPAPPALAVNVDGGISVVKTL